MRNAIRFLFTYITLLVVLLVMGTLLYSLYLNVTGYTAGSPLELFNFNDVIRSYVYVSECILIVICPLMSYYRIRHVNGLFQNITYVLLALLTWIIIFPVSVNFNQFLLNHYNIGETESTLTGGYFRTDDNKIYYLVSDYNHNGTTPVIEIDTLADKAVTFKEISSDENFPLLTAGKNYKDVIIRSTFVDSVSSLNINFRTIINSGIHALQRSFLSYLAFLSLAFALCSLYACTALFKWRLLNVCTHFIATAGILSLNSVFYTAAFEDLRTQTGNLALFRILSHGVDQPFLFVLNTLIGICFVIVGVISFVIHKSKED